MQTQELQGFLLINKPKNITSFDCIRRLKKLFKPLKIKIGHAGTLDPYATGLLIVAISRQATKHISQLMKLNKIYVATGKLGELTDTLDKTGKIIETKPWEHIDQEALAEAINNFGNEYEQIPPLFAALKYQGKPLYLLARKNKLPQEKLEKIVQQKQRTVQIHELRLLKFESPFFTVKAHVSHGTYIRSLINDIGQKLGTYATTYELERTKIGPFALRGAIDLSNFTSKEMVEKHIIPIEDIVRRVKEY